jgi:hypothetical protein
MASLHEYFVRDGAQNLTNQRIWALTHRDGRKLGEVTARLHLDFDANAKYVSLFIPDIPGVECPEVLALNRVAEILTWPEKEVGVQFALGGEKKDSKDLIFTGQIYLYSERACPARVEGSTD